MAHATGWRHRHCGAKLPAKPVLTKIMVHTEPFCDEQPPHGTNRGTDGACSRRSFGMVLVYDNGQIAGSQQQRYGCRREFEPRKMFGKNRNTPRTAPEKDNEHGTKGCLLQRQMRNVTAGGQSVGSCSEEKQRYNDGNDKGQSAFTLCQAVHHPVYAVQLKQPVKAIKGGNMKYRQQGIEHCSNSYNSLHLMFYYVRVVIIRFVLPLFHLPYGNLHRLFPGRSRHYTNIYKNTCTAKRMVYTTCFL